LNILWMTLMYNHHPLSIQYWKMLAASGFLLTVIYRMSEKSLCTCKKCSESVPVLCWSVKWFKMSHTHALGGVCDFCHVLPTPPPPPPTLHYLLL
jgi:hypothetical protein